jgi:hypothetical protein
MAKPTTDFRILERTSKGWARVWALIKAKYGDEKCYDAETGECWQYMCSTSAEHQFRHRSINRKRVYDAFPVEKDDFEKAPAVAIQGMHTLIDRHLADWKMGKFNGSIDATGAIKALTMLRSAIESCLVEEVEEPELPLDEQIARERGANTSYDDKE